MTDKFVNVEFPRQYPMHDVAEHEVLMSFLGDSEAIAFREWWCDAGATAFGKWIKKRQPRKEEST